MAVCLVAVLALPLVCGTAQAQTTPESIIGQCSASPPLSDFALIDVYPAEGTLAEKALMAGESRNCLTTGMKLHLAHTGL